jgi:hypothetical protein
MAAHAVEAELSIRRGARLAEFHLDAPARPLAAVSDLREVREFAGDVRGLPVPREARVHLYCAPVHRRIELGALDAPVAALRVGERAAFHDHLRGLHAPEKQRKELHRGLHALGFAHALQRHLLRMDHGARKHLHVERAHGELLALGARLVLRLLQDALRTGERLNGHGPAHDDDREDQGSSEEDVLAFHGAGRTGGLGRCSRFVVH